MKELGFIICGYPGIGKSSIACPENGIIDLESSTFHDEFNKDTEWWNYYCSTAENLAEQGYIVLCSSHSAVIETLSMTPCNLEIGVYAVCPTLDLKDQWIKRLEDRWKRTGLLKDGRAYERARDHYYDDVNSLINTSFMCFTIKDIDYDLMNTIEDICNYNADEFLFT